ncbi:Uncharacterized protein DBV15_02917 [Temnothorax longispinosus]|uniref:Uncharacterized protein n=1 Tax=Temnothorax longispinosus TaxID=300112 RepID=A0A4V3S7F4_9HYME|nr:Uncharacterized protein DBV15_02917 [Temnothorax longispinosus]
MSDIFGGITTCQVACYQPLAEHTLHEHNDGEWRHTVPTIKYFECLELDPISSEDNERPLERFSQFYRCIRVPTGTHISRGAS